VARRLDFKLTAPQSQAFQLIQKPTTDVNLEWGRGCGKSWFDRFCGWTWVARADHKPRLQLLEELGTLDKLTPEQREMAAGVKGIRVVFLMPTLKQFKGVHGSSLEGEIEQWRHLKPHANWTDYEIHFPGGSWITPFPADQHSSQRSRGIRCDVVICDEADDIDPSVFDAIVRPWFSEPWSLKIRVTSGTYKRGRHGLLYQRRQAGKDPEKPRYHTVRATYADNPEIVDREEVEDARQNTNPATFAREWECDPDAGEGIVYPFDESFHVRQPPPLSAFNEFIVGGDHGWVDPGVLLLGGIQGHGNDATLWLLDERYESECPNQTWDQRAKEWAFARAFYLDPSRPDRIRDYRVNSGVNAISADNNIPGGISQLANLMFKRQSEHGPDWCRFYVAPACVNTIREFGLYRRKKNSDGSFDEAPMDKNNHAMDSARYMAVGRFGRGDAGRHVTSGR
jgi:hypothetical protein